MIFVRFLYLTFTEDIVIQVKLKPRSLLRILIMDESSLMDFIRFGKDC